ncbi:MAG: hypothetical protein IKU37_05140 [Candidatus Gastranaerophilales bacterium]|nr:hypothetical protein [Candidatus Gastranaerophilales bacterium]
MRISSLISFNKCKYGNNYSSIFKNNITASPSDLVSFKSNELNNSESFKIRKESRAVKEKSIEVLNEANRYYKFFAIIMRGYKCK